MGSRGAAPGSKTRAKLLSVVASPPADLTAPQDLDPKAKDFFETHAEALAQAGMLTTQDLPAFIQLCRLHTLCEIEYSKVLTGSGSRPYIDLVKQFQSLAKQFGMTPAERKRQAVTWQSNLTRYETTKGEFDF